MLRKFIYILTPMLLLATFGCSCLQNYTLKTEPARAAILQGNYQSALALFPQKAAKGKDEVLIRMERAMILQNAGQFKESSEEFASADRKIREYEEKAVISASKTVAAAGTLLINEQVMPYEGEDFEIILMHALNAVNYLMNGDLDGARVEVRKSYERQEVLLGKHEKELREAQGKDQFTQWEQTFEQADSKGYEELKEKASSVGSVYQNAFASYISSFVYELTKEKDDAYIDLKKAYDAYPSCRSIQRDLIRLSKEIGFSQDHELWEKRFGKDEDTIKNSTDVFIVFSYGLAPFKTPLIFPIPTNHGFVFASLPVYQFSPSTVEGCRIVLNGISEDSSTVFDVDAVAARNLLDKFPIIFVKQVARSYLKAEATSQLAHQHNDAGAILGTLFSAITEQADLRAWSSLPKGIQAARVFVPKALKEISLEVLPGGGSSTIPIPQGASAMIVYCRAADNGLSIYTKSF